MQRQILHDKLSQVTQVDIASVVTGQSHEEIIILLFKLSHSHSLRTLNSGHSRACHHTDNTIQLSFLIRCCYT